MRSPREFTASPSVSGLSPAQSGMAGLTRPLARVCSRVDGRCKYGDVAVANVPGTLSFQLLIPC